MRLAILVVADIVLLREICNDSVNRFAGWLNEVYDVGHRVSLALLLEIFHLVNSKPVQLVEADVELGEEPRC